MRRHAEENGGEGKGNRHMLASAKRERETVRTYFIGVRREVHAWNFIRVLLKDKSTTVSTTRETKPFQMLMNILAPHNRVYQFHRVSDLDH